MRRIRISNYWVYYNDTRSLFSEYKNIFHNKIYHFTSNNPSPFIIDGGGHIGLATLYFKKIYPGSKIMIFEPDAVSLEMLKKNIEINNIRGVEIVESGLYSKSGTIGFIANQTDASKITENGSHRIEVDELSEYVYSEVDFLKLNIEGSELEVLKELEENKKIEHIREMCIEWHSFAGQNQNLGGLLEILERNGFKYLINHFDYKINKALKPPFRVLNKTQYYLLIYAKKKNLIV